MQPIDELQALVERILKFRQRLPEAQRYARVTVWMARSSMFIALVAVVVNVVSFDLPLLAWLAVFLSAGAFLHAAHQLVKAEAWTSELKTMADNSTTDLQKAQALLEDARTSTDERSTP